MRSPASWTSTRKWRRPCGRYRCGRASAGTCPPIQRIHEITQVYGTTMKALIHEEFGDGIMSAINFNMDIERVENEEGDRVRITYEGKFLPYQW